VIPLSLAEVAELCPGRLETSPGAEQATGVQIDSRRVEHGDLFVAVGGGAEFRGEALERGASSVLLPDDPFGALAALGGAVRDRSPARVVGITGSTGKTSTKDILAGLCRPHARTVASEGGHNNEIGLPLTLTRIEEDTEIVVAEMGMRGVGQIAELCEIARPVVGVITGIGPVHLELLGTVERVAEVKAEIVAALPPGGIAVVPADAPALEPLLDREDIDIVRFGEGGEVRLAGFQAFEDTSRVDVALDGERLSLEFGFTARHQAENALAALAAYRALGLPLAGAAAGAREVELSHWRGEEIPLPGGGLLINDAYNANPVSMRAALEHLAARAGSRRKVAVLGDMAELGPEGPAFHQQVGRDARALGIDLLVGVGDLARSYQPTAWAADAAAATPVVRDLLQPGDSVLVKGSRALGLEALAEALATVNA
jgi:UDP-N-acetylmuramoyl-tripeptide--D-alanyl-D-alanine ligase